MKPWFSTGYGASSTRLAELDQPLLEPHDVLEVHVRVHHAVQHQQRILETLGVEDRRRTVIRELSFCGRFRICPV